ncbi:MAG TPA: beta-N-acetylhexosaminidase [Chitinophagales bacterium]|nr:beta-N-acetylhexosaminidase [Bacteroidota bacterium]HMU99407.1 beta-N-acetylhexosaminidase [Chitinophagales bacterium]MCB0513017.1 beta-N-acetylhexosaminidase [Bacteroidota bacterium]HMV03891.1 beta-N-acetylhexosaminidase [Chitinophagales bacterium]HMW95558.1 beta-N-acetylhexosaminidase [Chitinophagales bacterium]
MYKSILVFFLWLNFIAFSKDINIIPQPKLINIKEGNFILTQQTSIVLNDTSLIHSASFFNEYLQSYYGFQLPIAKTTNNTILLELDSSKALEAYSFESNSDGIIIKGGSSAGVFYGIQTLIQLLPITNVKPLEIPNVVIEDEPAFAYRGMHLDVGRYFFPVDFVKQYIDYLALHKFNYFHWHLTEDQGWRIEIKKYPLLTTVGAWRNGTYKIERKKHSTSELIGNDNKKHGGFYTQEEIKEIVAYAEKRYITIIPEIEMPGHSNAAIAAYPYLSCFPDEPSSIKSWDLRRSTASNKKKIMQRIKETTKGKEVRQYWGISNDVYCVGKESTFEFLEDVLKEVLPLFPSKLIHIGGDECPKEHWNRCAACQSRMKELNLKNAHELQSYFIQRMEKYVNQYGKIIVGWDEILEGGLADSAVVMSWRGEAGGIKAANQNHSVLMVPNRQLYLDYPISKKHDPNLLFRGGYLPLKKVYQWNVVPSALSKDKQKYILGGQACVWTEYIPDIPSVYSAVFPRISAVSESLWTPISGKNFDDFKKRILKQKQRYQLWKVVD